MPPTFSISDHAVERLRRYCKVPPKTSDDDVRLFLRRCLALAYAARHDKPYPTPKYPRQRAVALSIYGSTVYVLTRPDSYHYNDYIVPTILRDDHAQVAGDKPLGTLGDLIKSKRRSAAEED